MSNFNMIGRDFEVIGINLKGSKKVPTLSLESENGEKLTVMLSDRSFLSQFKTGMEFRMKLYPGEQATLPLVPVSEPEPVAVAVEPTLPIKVTEASASIPDDVCPQGVYPNDYGHSEFCDACEHLQRTGDKALGMGSVSCDLDTKPQEELQKQESDSEEAPQ